MTGAVLSTHRIVVEQHSGARSDRVVVVFGQRRQEIALRAGGEAVLAVGFGVDLKGVGDLVATIGAYLFRAGRGPEGRATAVGQPLFGGARGLVFGDHVHGVEFVVVDRHRRTDEHGPQDVVDVVVEVTGERAGGENDLAVKAVARL